ncbi:PKD domain-containing protein [Pelobium manganitolerans]|uniref:PKD domain-containing protein n=1 Tax=Pelobium manganitolerans TaxID=1842495 RepID=UPI003FA34EA1
MPKFFVVFVLCIFLFASKHANGQGASNKGTDFWLGYGKHIETGQMVVYITSDVNTSATVSISNLGFSQTVQVPANGLVAVDIPTAAHLDNEGLSLNGIHITSQKPVIVYAHIYASSVSGATLVLPVNALGKEYYSINYKQYSNANDAVSWFFVVAVEDDTKVEITPSGDTRDGWKAGTTYTVSLQKGQVYNVLGTTTNIGNNSSGVDLTGSKITSVSSNGMCKKIAVFSGSSKISIACLNFSLPGAPGTADNLFQQAYPVSSWGKAFVTVPLKERDFSIYRIVKADPTAQVTLNGVPISASNFVNNFYYDFASTGIDQINSDKPIQVAQYTVSQNKKMNCSNGANDLGDPEMIYLNPIEQTLKSITMYSTGRFKILKHFINVVIKQEGVTSFKLDGQSVSSQFFNIPNSGYAYAQLNVAEGTHNLSSDVGFNAVAYGFGGNESYGYAAGANLTAFGILPVVSGKDTVIVQSGCVNTAYDITLKLPYLAQDIQLDTGDGQGFRYVSLPANPTKTTENGQDAYSYVLIPNLRYQQAKSYSYKVLATKPSADACGSADEFLLDFNVYNQPLANFNAPQKVCVGNPASLSPIVASGERLTAYLWDLNGEVHADSVSLNYVFNSTGIKSIKLSVKSEDGCWSDFKEKQLEVVPLPKTDFSAQNITCEQEPIQFADETTLGTIVKWFWDFGDSTSTSNTSNLQNPSHTFAVAKTYIVTLKTVTDLGCENSISKQIKVFAKPQVDFELPDICLNDATAIFTNKSSAPDQSALSYKWDFGDVYATPANNLSSQTDGKHSYHEAALYNVSLTATSANGCATTLTKSFTVNGSTPKAAFSVQNANNLCSDEPVIFEDLATVDFGEITRIEWVFDNSQPTVVEIDEMPASRLERQNQPKTYPHRYNYANLDNPKTLNVLMRAYSGQSCVSTSQQSITLYPSPKILFDTVKSVCADIEPFLLTEARELKGLKGLGKYSGDAVDENGLFSPAIAGVGVHPITYTFITDKGCSSSKISNIEVFETPKADAGADKVILLGGSVSLDGTASGKNVKFEWSPVTDLSNYNSLSPTASPKKDITYTLTVISEEGCVTKKDVFVKVLQFPEIPNTFTPNGDGINDVWNIKYLDSYPDCTIKIYNRYGKEVFVSTKYKAWDGKLDAQDLPEGTYYYVITAKNNELKYSGSLLLVR